MTQETPKTTEISLEQVKAVNVLIAAAQLGQKAGAFSLSDAKYVHEAIMAFAPAQPEVEEAAPEMEAAS